jgi:hypothetical protein
VILVWVAVFAVHGFLRGSVAQVFVVIGLVAGVWAVFWVARWLGAHWRGAQPAWVYIGLLWIVSSMAGMAAAGLIQWWGDRLGQTVPSSPIGWLDRGAGLVSARSVWWWRLSSRCWRCCLRRRGVTTQVASSRVSWRSHEKPRRHVRSKSVPPGTSWLAGISAGRGALRARLKPKRSHRLCGMRVSPRDGPSE